MHVGFKVNFYKAVFLGLMVLIVRIAPATALRRNSLDFPFKVIVEMGALLPYEKFPDLNDIIPKHLGWRSHMNA